LSIHYREQGSALIVLGNTYPYRDQLKAMGARFNGADKHWRLPISAETLRQIAELCAASGGGNLDSGGAAEALTAFPSRPPLTMQTSTPSLYTGPVPGVDGVDGAATELQISPGPTGLSTIQDQASPSLTIRQLMERLERAMSIAFPQALWVTGEVQNLSRKASGVFFDLAEGRGEGHANATITVRAIIWQGVLKGVATLRGPDVISDVLQDGMKIRCLCQVQLYKDRGSVSLLVTDIDPSYTKGALALAREKLLKELRAKGLDQANKRLDMPRFPLRLGLISADASRAKSDFLDQLHSLNYPGEVLFCSCVMQGEQVPKQVVAALTALQARGCDLIVLTRGGGSAADLRWFDAAEIAYAIAGAKVPIIAAIGHHDDVCVAEEVCHLRQKTPTAAADYVISLIQGTRDCIDALAHELAKSLDGQVDAFQRRLASVGERLSVTATLSLEARSSLLSQRVHQLQRSSLERLESRNQILVQRSHALSRHGEGQVNRLSSQLAEVRNKLERSTERTLTAKATQILALESQLGRLDPSGWLAQGWTQLSNATGRVRSVAQAVLGGPLKARLLDGWLGLEVTHIQPDIQAEEADD